jgi:hypothetical protein
MTSSDGFEMFGIVDCSESFQKLLVAGAEPIVRLICRSPKSVATTLGERVNFENCIVAGCLLERDTLTLE